MKPRDFFGAGWQRVAAGVAVGLLASFVAWSKANIQVDGKSPDWASTTTCYVPTSGAGNLGAFSRECVENNSDGGTTGSLFNLFEWDAGIPNYHWFGTIVDTNGDGQITDSDRIWVVHYANLTSGPPSTLTVYSATTYSQIASYNYSSVPRTCGGSADAGWDSQLSVSGSNGTLELSVPFSCLGISGGSANLLRLSAWNAMGPGQTTYYTAAQSYYNPAQSTLFTAGTPSDLGLPTVLSGPHQNTLYWNNPPGHEGVVVLRSTGASPDAGPVNGTTYTAGQTLGNATVVYSDANYSQVSSFVDTGLTNGTRYFYKSYNHWQHATYSPSTTPSPAGLFAEPTSRVSPSPLFCYSEGSPNPQQPVTFSGTGALSAGNLGAITANAFSATPTLDGQELFRPVALAGAVQSRFPVVPLYNRAGKFLLTGDQTGHTYVIDAADGGILWRGLDGGTLGSGIQAQPVVQLSTYANAAYQAAHPADDLIFFGTHNGDATSNQVTALSSQSGAAAWTYKPGDLDIINGGMMVDYANNHLWVASHGGDGGQASLRVLSTLDGGILASFNAGALDYGVVEAYGPQQAVVINNAGTVYGFGLTTLSQQWSAQLDAGAGLSAAPNSYAYPVDDHVLGSGFIVSLKGGVVQRYVVNGSSVSLLWSASVPNSSGIAIYYPRNIYVGGKDGKLYELDATDGGVLGALNVSSSALGTPSVSNADARVTVGSLDGRLCNFAIPF